MTKIPIKDGNNTLAKSAQKNDQLEPLTAEEIKFSNLVAQGFTLTKAYRQSFPAKKDLTNDTVRVNAAKLFAKASIATEVATTKERNAELARLAEGRMYEILADNSTEVKGSRVADIAMFVYDHMNGKATQRVEMQSKTVNLNIDLTM